MIEAFAVGGLCVMALIITYMFYKGVVYFSHDIPSYRYKIDKNGNEFVIDENKFE